MSAKTKVPNRIPHREQVDAAAGLTDDALQNLAAAFWRLHQLSENARYWFEKLEGDSPIAGRSNSEQALAEHEENLGYVHELLSEICGDAHVAGNILHDVKREMDRGAVGVVADLPEAGEA